MKRKILLSLLFTVMIAMSAFSQGIVITEINYNDPSSTNGGAPGDSLEYVELYNNSTFAIDMTGFVFTSGITYTFPTMVFQPHTYLVVARAATKVQNFYGITGVLQWDAGQSLSNTNGEGIALKDAFFNMIDTVRYNTNTPWPTTPNGGGPSLMLCDPNLDNNVGSNWVAANAINANAYGMILTVTLLGTPGTGCITLPPYFPKYATIPFTASFETAWKNANYLRDVPDTVWLNTPSSGNASWRRNDDGGSAGWTFATTGAYTPGGSAGSSYSARFHTAALTAGTVGDLDLFLNLNTPGIKKLKFWYNNTSGSDSLSVWFSEDAGATFTNLGPFVNTTTWEQKQVLLGSTTSQTCIIRFRATAQAGTSDIGLDNVNVDLMLPDDAGVLSIAAPGSVVANQTDTVKVVLKNYGGNDINNVNINWSIGGNVQTPVAYTTTIASGATTGVISLGAYTFPATGPVTIKTWTSLPNGNADTDPTNDTVWSSTYYQPYAAVPFYEGFDSTWVNKQAVRDVPSNYWSANPSTGTQAIRRDDDGASAGWTNLTGGQYVLTAADGTIHSARFHTSGQTNSGGTAALYLYADMTTPGYKTLKFWYYSPAGSDNLVVSMSTDNGANYTTLGTYNNQVAWEQKSIELGNITTAQTIIQFRFNTPNAGQSDLGFDNVSISILQPNNAGVQSITAPSAVLNNLIDTVKVVLRNYGANDLSSANINWSVNGNVQPVVPFSGTLAPFTNTSAITLGAYTFPASGISTIKVWTSEPNGLTDTEPANDTSFKNVFYQPYASLPFYEGFDSTWVNKQATRDVPSHYWVANPITGNNSWRRADDGASASWINLNTGGYTPTGALGTTQSARYHTGGSAGGSSGTLNLYVNMNIPGDKEMRFYHNNTAGGDSLAIYMSTDGGTTFSFINRYQVSPSWTQFVVPLGNISSPNTVFRFKCTTNNNGNTDVGLDELRVDLVKPDVGISKLIKPQSGCGFLGNDTVVVRVKNYGNMEVSNISVYSPAGTFLIPNTLQPGDSIDWEVGTINIPAASSLSFKVYTDYPDDPNPINDTLKVVLTHYQAINTFPYVDNFENGTTFFTTMKGASNANVMIQNAIGNQNSKGLLMTGQIAGSWPGNSQNNTTPEQAFAYLDHKGEFMSSCMVDATSLATPELRVDVKQTYSAGPAYSYFRVVVNDTVVIPDQEGKFYFNPVTQNADNFINRRFDLSQYGGTTFKLSLISACKWNQANAQSGIGDNVIIDNFTIRSKVPFDAGLTQILSPASNCGLGNETLSIRVVNFGFLPIPTLPLAFSVNGGTPVVQNYSNLLSPGDTLNFNFTQLLNLTAPGVYNIMAYVAFQDDMEHSNDTIHFQITNIPNINTFPYNEDFEGSFSGWISGAKAGVDEWELGMPAKSVLDDVHSGSKAWVTRLTQNYSNNSDCFVQSPCFNLSGTVNPILSVWLKMSSEQDIDGMIIESSISNGEWVRLNGDPGFYNNNANLPPLAGQKWSGNNGGWVQYKTSVANFNTQTNVKFRFRFVTNDNTVNEGFAFDDFRIREAASDLVTSWVFPNSGCDLGLNELIKVSVKNEGEKTASYASYYYSFGGITYVDSVGGDILPGQTVTHTTWNAGNMNTPGNVYTLTMDVHYDGDIDPTNNIITKEVVHLSPITALVFTDGFESTETKLEFVENTNSHTAIKADVGFELSGAVMKGGAAGTWPTGTSDNTPAETAFGYADHRSEIKTCDLNLPGTYPSVWLRFMMKQTYSEGADYSWFKVLVNDTIEIAATNGTINFQPATASSDAYALMMYDLTPYYAANNLKNIVLQSACMYDEANSPTEIADAVYIDNYVLDFTDGIHTVNPMLLSVTPNPTHDMVRVDLFNVQEGQLYLTDMMGRIVTARTLNGQHTEVLDLREYPSGIYSLRINSNNGNQTVKIVKH